MAVRTFLDLAPSKLVEEDVDFDAMRNPNFWKEFYDHVQLQVKRISGMLADLSDAGDSPEEFGEEASLAEVVGRVVEASDEILTERALTVETDIPADLPPLRVNRAKFDRLFELFVRDEVASLSEGKTIRISARTETLEDAPWVSVRIEDNGSGLPEEELRRLFNPFYVRSDDPKSLAST